MATREGLTVRADEGGFRFELDGDVFVRNANLVSDAAVKSDFSDVDSQDILRRLVGIPIKSWRYRAQQPGVRHVGPNAQNFREAFGLGDDEHISSIDAHGIALVSIQALNEKLEEENGRLRAGLADLERRLAALEAKR